MGRMMDKPTKGEKEVYARMGLIEKLKRDLPLYHEEAEIMAAVRMINYKALIAAGFTEAQALELVKKT